MGLLKTAAIRSLFCKISCHGFKFKLMQHVGKCGGKWAAQPATPVWSYHFQKGGRSITFWLPSKPWIFPGILDVNKTKSDVLDCRRKEEPKGGSRNMNMEQKVFVVYFCQSAISVSHKIQVIYCLYVGHLGFPMGSHSCTHKLCDDPV